MLTTLNIITFCRSFFKKTQQCYWQKYLVYHFRCTSIDGARVCRMTVTGMVLGVIAHHWYIFLDKRYTGTTLRIVMKKTLIDQLVLGPICLLTFLGLLSILEGSYYKGFKSELYKKGPEMVAVDWLVYPPAQFINFKFLPSRFRVLYDCCIAFALDIYYSHIKYER